MTITNPDLTARLLSRHEGQSFVSSPASRGRGAGLTGGRDLPAVR